MYNLSVNSYTENKDVWNQDKAEELYIFFLNNFLKSNIVSIFKDDANSEIKSKAFADFKLVCENMVVGYRNKDLFKMENAINQMMILINYTNEIGEK